MKHHYFKTKVVKMGQWALLPLDSETWHGENTNHYFKKLFGIPKGNLAIHTLADGYQHMYTPKSYLEILHNRIGKISSKNFKGMEKKLKTFYNLVPKSKKDVSKKIDFSKLTNWQLIKHFRLIRDRIQHLAVYDQFAWLGDEYWPPLMEKVLVNKYGLRRGSEDYNQVLFKLTKPQEVSTTLKEKMAVTEEILCIKNGATTLDKASKKLAKKFGWLPVFTFGEPWQAKHYQQELKVNLSKPLNLLNKEYGQIKNYTKIRAREIKHLINKYKFKPKDLQIFTDFGLAIDTRNEAEYFVSFGSFYLLPLYDEIAKRLFLSVNQLRTLTEQELIEALLGKIDTVKLLQEKGKYAGWGFDRKIQKRIEFTAKETEKLFKYIESYVKPVQGGDENKGVCASPGKATGKIRIVPYPKDNGKVKQGDILVTYATTTDYLPAMKRAAAIITEVGGLTCHAAVVSREFGIPCIVALNNAMKNFKDGELVEVDANKGIVRKIIS